MLGRVLSICVIAVSLSGQQEQTPAKPAAPPRSSRRTGHFADSRSRQRGDRPGHGHDDQEGRFVSNLDENDFKIFDQGVEQNITYFNRERNQPVVIGFLIEQSNTLRLYWKTFQEAATELVLALMPEDPRFSGYLISYGSQAELQVNTTQDPTEMVEKIKKMKPGGGAALFDAIYMACTNRELVEGEPIEPRRVIVIIGDGHDNASSKTLEEVLELAQRNLVTVHGISTVSYEFNAAEEGNLLKLARETGGRVEYPMNDLYKDVSGTFRNLPMRATTP